MGSVVVLFQVLNCVHFVDIHIYFSFLVQQKVYVSGYHADTPITIKAEPSIWPTAAFINIHEHPL